MQQTPSPAAADILPPPRLAPGDRFLRLAQVCDLIGARETFVTDATREGTFPASIKIGSRYVVWLESEVRSWMLQRVLESKQAA